MDGYEINGAGLFVPAQSRRALNVVDLFCGCGGFSLGFEAAGLDVVGALENDASAAHTYLWNLGSPRGCAVGYVDEADRKRFNRKLKPGKGLDVQPGDLGWIGYNKVATGGWGPLGVDCGCRGMMFGDASRVTGEDLIAVMEAGGWRGEVDIVIGGPPCQGMSMMGRQREDDPRNNLVLEFVRIAGELDARGFMMENVPPLVKQTKFRPLFEALVESAHGYGYNIAATVVDAVEYGVPQYRRRAIIQGYKEGAPAFPMPTNYAITARVGEEIHGVTPPGWAPGGPSPEPEPDRQGSLFAPAP